MGEERKEEFVHRHLPPVCPRSVHPSVYLDGMSAAVSYGSEMAGEPIAGARLWVVPLGSSPLISSWADHAEIVAT